MLLSKLSCILDQPYDVNLVVTSLASRLCLVSNAAVHEYFADPLTDTRPGVFSLYTCLQVSKVNYAKCFLPGYSKLPFLSAGKIVCLENCL